jgi:hypothetical protein
MVLSLANEGDSEKAMIRKMFQCNMAIVAVVFPIIMMEMSVEK